MKLDQTFRNSLRRALKGDLPGQSAHLKMASRLRLDEMKFSYDTSRAVHSSVLILLYPKKEIPHTVFILRQTYDGVHSGQVSFPGGRAEEADRTLVETALREASEEVNIDPGAVEVLGTLSEMYIPPSNYLVLPVVGFTPQAPAFVPDPAEVAAVIESDLGFLFDQSRQKETVLTIRGTEIEAPYYDVNGNIVWGATAMILSELSHVIESIA